VTLWIAAAVSMQLLDTVALVDALPDEGLPAGGVGTIVHIFVAGSAFEVEFTADDGGTIALVTLRAGALRPA
jgi:hypothetical protein